MPVAEAHDHDSLSVTGRSPRSIDGGTVVEEEGLVVTSGARVKEIKHRAGGPLDIVDVGRLVE